jgi:hypothetical protein
MTVRTLKQILKWVLIALLLVILVLAIWIGPRTYSALFPSHEHDTVAPAVPASFPLGAVLVFSKTNGFRHNEAIAAGSTMFRELAAIDRFLAALAAASEAVEVSFQWRPQLRDANDEMVLETALNGQTDALVTHNVKDFASAAERFGLRILRPGELLKEMRS